MASGVPWFGIELSNCLEMQIHIEKCRQKASLEDLLIYVFHGNNGGSAPFGDANNI